jgi:hypothetical protein
MATADHLMIARLTVALNRGRSHDGLHHHPQPWFQQAHHPSIQTISERLTQRLTQRVCVRQHGLSFRALFFPAILVPPSSA